MNRLEAGLARFFAVKPYHPTRREAGESWPGPGLTVNGVPDAKSLVVRGWQRAGSWSALFGAGLGGLDYPAPSVIYAADPNAKTGDETSQGFLHIPAKTPILDCDFCDATITPNG